jgi:hypothetical protein
MVTAVSKGNLYFTTTVTLKNNTSKMIKVEKHNDMHGGIYYDFTCIPPWGKGIFRCESGGFMTGVEGSIKCGIMDVSTITTQNVNAFRLPPRVREMILGLLAGGRKSVYFPSRARRQATLDIRVCVPFAGSNDFACDILGASKWYRKEGPTGLVEQKRCMKGDRVNTHLTWNATAGNKANMNIQLHY